MVVLQASMISKYFKGKNILDGVGITVQSGEKVGLVGTNGAGKTTLLKILSGEMKPETGEIVWPGGATHSYLAQDGGLSSSATVMEEMLSVFQPLIDQENNLRKLERLMGEKEALEDPRLMDQLAAEYSLLSEEFRDRGGYGFRAEIRSVLHGLKFGEEYYDRVTGTLSGGQKTRLAMAGALLSRPDVLILDEPTNHLDMQTMSWLEKYLQSYPGSILVVSHDRYFLDSLVNTVYELDMGRLRKYPGNYSRFVSLRAEQIERERKQYHRQQEEIARAQDFIRRNIARASTTGRAQSRKKTLEKIDLLEKPAEFKSARFIFSINRHSVREVLTAKKLAVGYKNKPLVTEINLLIERGERVALIGPNGSGKSTFLKTVAGHLSPLGGHLSLGINVDTGYYDQDQSALEGSHTVLEEIWGRFPHIDEKDIRKLLGNFLFTGDDVFKIVDSLSGGEKARLVLAGLMLKKANFLLLDEPTNHLDVYSREVLEDALAQFEGTILFVSHDRYFLNKLATRVIEISPAGLTGFPGNYDNFLAKMDSQSAAQCHGSPVSPEKETARLSYRQEKEAQRMIERMKRQSRDLEKVIGEIETAIASIEEEIYLPEVSSDFDLLMKKSADLEKYKEDLNTFYAQWESVTSRLEEAEAVENKP